MQSDSYLPPDATVTKQIDSWAIHTSSSKFAMYIETTDYHARPLELSFNDLQELLGIMEDVREQAKRNAISLLQDSLKQMIADDPAKKILEGCRIELLPPEK